MKGDSYASKMVEKNINDYIPKIIMIIALKWFTCNWDGIKANKVRKTKKND